MSGWLYIERQERCLRQDLRTESFVFGSVFLFRRIPAHFSSRPPRRSLPLGLVEGGRATSKSKQRETTKRMPSLTNFP